MAQLTLIRHGQANTGARDEVSYDRLSDLGREQAGWLGSHFAQSGEVFAHAYTGTLTRHLQTAEAMGQFDTLTQDERLNEMEYFMLGQLLLDQHGVPIPTDREGFTKHLPLLMTKWRDGELSGTPETFADFETRVGDFLREASAKSGRVVAVTSGGLIGMAVRLTMGLDLVAMSRVCLAIMNTSVHRWHVIGDALAVTQFNAVPHLEHPHRQFAQTHL